MIASLAFFALWVAAMLLGLTGSEDPLIRVACGCALVSMAVVAGALTLVPTATRWLMPILGLLAVVGVAGTLALGIAWGGGALNGRIADGGYYLADHGVETEAGRVRYWTMATLETTAFVALPALFLALAWEDRTSRRSPPRDPS